MDYWCKECRIKFKNYPSRKDRKKFCSRKCYYFSMMKDNIHYQTLHRWIRDKYGSANKCESRNCKTKNPKRFEWALKTGRPYSRNIKDYIQLCVNCHKRHDRTPGRKGRAGSINTKILRINL